MVSCRNKREKWMNTMASLNNMVFGVLTRVYMSGERSMSVCVCVWGGGVTMRGGGWRGKGGDLALACRNMRVKSCPLLR